MKNPAVWRIASLLLLPHLALAEPWLPPLQLEYALQGHDLGLPLRGSGRFSWWQAQEHYQVELSASSLVGASYSSQGRIADGWLQPDLYEQRLFIRHLEVTFDRARGQLTFSGGAPAQPITPRMQDSASVFAQLTHLVAARGDWTVGQTLDFDLARPGGVAHWSFVLLDQPWLQTGLGPLQTWHWQVRTPQGEPGDEIWLAPRLHDLPARIHLQQGHDDLLFSLQSASLALEDPASAPSSAP